MLGVQQHLARRHGRRRGMEPLLDILDSGPCGVRDATLPSVQSSRLVRHGRQQHVDLVRARDGDERLRGYRRVDRGVRDLSRDQTLERGEPLDLVLLAGRADDVGPSGRNDLEAVLVIPFPVVRAVRRDGGRGRRGHVAVRCGAIEPHVGRGRDGGVLDGVENLDDRDLAMDLGVLRGSAWDNDGTPHHVAARVHQTTAHEHKPALPPGSSLALLH